MIVARLLLAGLLGGLDAPPTLTPGEFQAWFDSAREGRLVIPPDGPKTRNLRRDPRVTFLVMDERGYTYVTIRGTARLESGEEGTKPREMAIRYLGEEAGRRFAERDYIKEEIVCRITPTGMRLRRDG